MPKYADDEDLLKEARPRFKLVSETEAPQREREREDLLFQIPENQWPEAARAERTGGVRNGVATPARPMLSVSLLLQPMQLVQNQASKASLGVNFHPVSEKAKKETAEVLQGIYRRIERDSNANDARLWGLDRAKQCGRGWYRINTRYDEDSPDTWDQEIGIERILHQECVYVDPASQKRDFSDAKWLFYGAWFGADDFKEAFPGVDLPDNKMAWEALMRAEPEWVKFTEGDQAAVFVAEYWYKDVRRETIKGPKGLTREKLTTTVYVCKLSAAGVVEKPQVWPGRLFPFVPVIGRELQPVDGERRWEGMVRPSRDAQMGYNYAISAAVEDIGRLSKTPYMVAEGQIEGFEETWNQINVRNLPYVQYRPVDAAGKPAPPPQPMQIDGTKLGLSLQMASSFRDMAQAATSVYDPALGNLPERKDAQSGRAILALQSQTDAGTSQYLDNLVNVSMRYEAEVVKGLIPIVYDRPGRIAMILGDEDEEKMVMLGAPFVRNAEGFPVQPPPGAQNVEHYVLTDGAYSVSTDAGKSFQTRLQEGGEMLGELLAKAPGLMPIIGPTYFKFQDWPGAKEVSELLKKMREKQYPGLGDDENAPPSPEALQAKLEGQGQQMQLMQSQLQAAVNQIQTEQAKQQAAIEKARMDNETKERIAAADNETKLAVAGIQSRIDAVLAALEQGTKVQVQREKMAHDVGMAHAGGTQISMNREQGQEDEQEQANEMSDGESRAPVQEEAEA